MDLFAQCQHFFFLLVSRQRAVLPDRHSLVAHIFANLLKLFFLCVCKVQLFGEHRHMLAASHTSASLRAIGLRAILRLSALAWVLLLRLDRQR